MSVSTNDPHNCGKCGKSFKYKSLLNKHLNRKTPCDPIVTIASDDLLLLNLKNVYVYFVIEFSLLNVL